GERGRQVAADHGAGRGGRRRRRGGGRLRYRDRCLRAVGRGPRQGRGGRTIRRSRRRNRLVLLDPIEEPHPISRLKGGEVVLRVYLLLADTTRGLDCLARVVL